MSNFFLIRQLFLLGSFCVSFFSIALSISSLNALRSSAGLINPSNPRIGREQVLGGSTRGGSNREIVVDNFPGAPIAWCILDDDNSNPRHFHHFPHASQILLPCWSYFSRERERNPSIACGFWLDSEQLELSAGWVTDFVATLGCTVTHVAPISLQFSHRPQRHQHMTWFHNESDSASLREQVVGTVQRSPVPFQPRIGLVQRKSCWTRGNRFIHNLSLIQTELQEQFPDSVVQLQHMEDMDFKEQASWWSQQDVVVGAHGASMTNLIFLTPAAAVVEIFPEHFYPIDFYQSLSASCGVRHFGWYNNVTDPLADYRAHCHNAVDRDRYRTVDLTPPLEQVVELVRQAVTGRDGF